MTPLADVGDLAARLGRDLTDVEEIRAMALLDDVSAAVRAYTGQQFTVGEVEARLPVRRSRVRLPQRPVTAVDSVADVDGNDLEFTWDAGDVVYLTDRTGVAFAFEIASRRTPLRWVDVTYTAGYEAVPADIVAVVCQVVGRAFGSTSEQAGVTSESIGDASISYGSAVGSGPLGLLTDERAVLDRYRRFGSTIHVSA